MQVQHFMSDLAKQDRRTVVLQTIQTLKQRFPLQKNIENADAPLRQTYIETLSHWIHQGMPPAKDCIPEPLLEALCSSGALVIDEYGISCYPFSARDTDIQVRYAGMSVHALCAIDALAIPRLVGQEAHITARCCLCRCHIACSVEANGSVDGGYSEGLRVIWIPGIAAEVGRHTLCKEIAVICTHCVVPREAISFTVPQAAVIGNSFFSFQKSLLVQQKS